MTNYIEYVLLENLVINYITIYQVSIFTKIKSRKINTVIGIIILSFYSTINYYIQNSFITNILIKILVVNFCIYIIYLPKKIKIYIKVYLYYFLISFLMVGIIISFVIIFKLNISNIITKIIIYFCSGFVLYIFNKFMWKMWKSKIKKDDLIYDIKIGDIKIQGFVDTGNNVYDYVNKLDVVFLEKQFEYELFKNNLLHEKVKLNINTITGRDEVEGYIVKNIMINKNEYNICILKKLILIFVDKKIDNNNEYKALISYDTYIDKLKGVELC